MDRIEVEKYFMKILKQEEDVSAGIAGIRTLMEIIKKYKSGTLQGLNQELKAGMDVMLNTNYPVASITSGCELFLRFITLVAGLDVKDFNECKQIMLKRGDLFLKKLSASRGKIVKLAARFITDGSRVLTHSRSRAVLHTLIEAAKHKRFEVFITKSSPDDIGERMCKELEAANISCTLILDSAVGYIMEQVDFVMVGAEAVVESGGIINKIGSYTTALCAKTMNKPFYVLAESFKFSRVFPLNQSDLPDAYKYTPNMRTRDLDKEHPLVDYTPPSYITLLFTDLGILTPSAVSDELIKLYL